MSAPEHELDPFTSPAAMDLGAPSADVMGFEPPRRGVTAGLYVYLVLSVLQIPLVAMLGDDLHDPAFALDPSALGIVHGLLALLTGLTFLVTAVLWARWVLRAARNLRAMAPDTYFEFSPGSHIWWYFVPFLGLWKPYEGIKEIDYVSRLSLDVDEASRSAPVGLWWGLWLGNGLLGWIVMLSKVWLANVVALALAAGASWVAVQVIARINDVQGRWRSHAARAPAPAG